MNQTINPFLIWAAEEFNEVVKKEWNKQISKLRTENKVKNAPKLLAEHCTALSKNKITVIIK